jgi:prepilin-type N-terminal cleavage/methylation domain-containing protein
MRKAFTLIELCIVLAIMAGMAALTMPSINRFVKRIEHMQRVNVVIEKIYQNRKDSYEDGVAWVDDIWYTPFDVEPHTIVVDDERIVVQSFYIIKRKPCLTKPQQKP